MSEDITLIVVEELLRSYGIGFGKHTFASGKVKVCCTFKRVRAVFESLKFMPGFPVFRCPWSGRQDIQPKTINHLQYYMEELDRCCFRMCHFQNSS